MAETLSNRKSVLLFTAKLGYQTRSFEEAARELGVDLVYVTDRCHQLEDPWNDRAIAARFESPELAAHAVIESVRTNPPAGILALGDRPALAAAYAARGLGIPFNHPLSVEACRSKLRMREIFREVGLPSPWFKSFPLDPTPEPALAGVRFPCVVKPLSLSASQGVQRANNAAEFRAAWLRLRNLLRSPQIRATREPNLDAALVEGYLPGREVAVEALLTDAQLRILAIFDKPDPLEGPFFEESIYVTPSRLTAAEQDAIGKAVRIAVSGLGLAQGPIHAEFRIHNGEVWPLEVAPRPIGGLCSRALRFSPGPKVTAPQLSLESLLLRHALNPNDPLAAAPRESAASAVMMIPVPRTGILNAVHGEDAARATPAITELLITARLRDTIVAWPEGSSYLGFLFARAEHPQDAERALREAHAKLHFDVSEELPVQHPAAQRAARPSSEN